MSQRSLIIGMVLALSMILLAAPTWATCDLQDLTGRTWTVEVGSADRLAGHCWGRCAGLVISPSGVITDGIYFDCAGKRSSIKGGELTISPDCVIQGYIQTKKATIYVQTGAVLGKDLCVKAQD